MSAVLGNPVGDNPVGDNAGGDNPVGDNPVNDNAVGDRAVIDNAVIASARDVIPHGALARTVIATVVMPVRDAAATLPRSLGSLLAQDAPPGTFEIVVADGGSADGTVAVARRMAGEAAARGPAPQVRVVGNPAGHAASGMNAGIAAARGAVVIRLDAHAVAPPDFVSSLLRALDAPPADGTPAPVCVGPALETHGEGGPAAHAVALAMSTPFGAGSAAFRTSVRRDADENPAPVPVDTVAFGAVRRADLLALGGYDESFPRNQDDELNLRLAAHAARAAAPPGDAAPPPPRTAIAMLPGLRVTYLCRRGIAAAAAQYARYGFHKVRVLFRHGRLGSARAFAPAALVGAFVVAALLAGSGGDRAPLLLLSAAYAAALVIATACVATTQRAACDRVPGPAWPLLPFAYAALHLGYGVGFWLGVLAAPFDHSVPELPFRPQPPDALRADVADLPARPAMSERADIADLPARPAVSGRADVASVFARRDAAGRGGSPRLRAFFDDARERALAALLDSVPPPSSAPRPALDLGCGRGDSLPLLARLAAHRSGGRSEGRAVNAAVVTTVGIDLLPARLADAPHGAASPRLAAADAARLPFRDGSLALVLCATSLGSMPRDVRAAAAAEAMRVLAPGGTVLVWDLRLARPGGDGAALSVRELRALFPGWTVRAATAGLLPPFVRSLPGPAARALSRVPFLRSHLAAAITPPAP